MDPRNLSFSTAGGDVDLLERLTKLRLLFSSGSLTNQEHRYIKILLSKVNVDLIGELPVEIVGQIAQLLDLHEFVCCLAISRRWRGKFLSPSIIGAIANKYCPSLKHSGNPVNLDNCLNALHRIGRLRWKSWQARLTKEFSWEHESYFKLDPVYHGDHDDTSTVYAQFGHYDNDPEPDDQAYSTALYSRGKIAWLAKPRIVVVDNLWARTRKIFTMPTGALAGLTLQILALGNRLVVGTMNRILVAWDHTTNEFLDKRLPGPIKYAATEGSRVAVVLFNGDAFLWEFGGKVSMIATAPLKQHQGLHGQPLRSWVSNLRIFFHPTCNRTLLLASGYTHTGSRHSETILRRVVYEFKDINHTETFEFEFPAKKHDHANPIDPKVDIQKVLPYRRDIIGFCERHYRPLSRFLVPYQYETFIEFDIYERQFTARTKETFDLEEFGWRAPLEDADLDFEIKFYSNGFTAVSHQPGFEFENGG
ncbi:uncharacterized protein F4817DRAFT_143489 [Daldinia loculata]|uniref:uncharacterized protein n=1 Tax=Daldinia loculata TaxID=103429 RepID=UPI0020C5948D|nr:uncharacterized protein F4817DRAFT_143489 [Daldinia loculata]KAI1646559.1 hypothetical protein F4817DRAFT_143489 [Daldinia loculata]